jgi:hypothetical protein
MEKVFMKWPIIPRLLSLWIFKCAYVGQASRLSSKYLCPQARRPRYITKIKKGSLLAIKWLCIAFAFQTFSGVIAAQEPSPTPPPSTSIQVVNATSVPSISLEINGRLIFPDFPQGKVSGSPFVQGLNYRYKATNKADGVSVNSQAITFKNLENQTLLLIGDFSDAAEEGTLPQPKPPFPLEEESTISNPPSLIYRTYFHQAALEKSPLQIRIINGMPRKILKLHLPNSPNTLDFLPGEEKELVGQPPVHKYFFEVDGKTIPVIMLQDSNPVNANIVFYLENNEPAFKRFFESTRRPEPDDYSEPTEDNEITEGGER